MDQRAWDQVADAVSAGDFYRHDHCLVFEAIGTLVERDEPADAVTVIEQLEQEG